MADRVALPCTLSARPIASWDQRLVFEAAVTSFEEVFDDATRRKLVGSLVLVCGDRARAEEIAQDALATGWAHWFRISRYRSPRAWVWKCALNAATTAARRDSAEGRAIMRLYEGPQGTEDPALRLALQECLDRLSERQRAAIVCRYYGELSVRETATVMNCREGTVKALTSQAIDRLREMELIDRSRPAGHGSKTGALSRSVTSNERLQVVPSDA